MFGNRLQRAILFLVSNNDERCVGWRLNQPARLVQPISAYGSAVETTDLGFDAWDSIEDKGIRYRMVRDIFSLRKGLR